MSGVRVRALAPFPSAIVGGEDSSAVDGPRAGALSRMRLARLASTADASSDRLAERGSRARRVRARSRQALKETSDVTDQEKQKAEELISRLELSVGQMFPRDGGNAALITSMIQSLNGLRSLLGLVRPH